MDYEILKEYRKKAVAFLITIIIISATAAAVVFPIMKIAGLYPRHYKCSFDSRK